MPGRDGLDSLNLVKYVYLRELTEPRDNSLRLVVDEAVVNYAAPARSLELPELAEILTKVAPIETIEGCESFELFWKSCVAYLVTEELVGSSGTYDDEEFAGGIFRVYTKSHFLEHLARDTGGHPEPILHYKLVCLNHLIDVASYGPPEILLIDSPSQPSRRIR